MFREYVKAPDNGEQEWKETRESEETLVSPSSQSAQLRSFLRSFFYDSARERTRGLAALPVILLRNLDNAAAMNNGGITRQKSANVFFRAVSEPRASQKFRIFVSFAIWLSLLRYQTALNVKLVVGLTGGYHIIITHLDCVVFLWFCQFQII